MTVTGIVCEYNPFHFGHKYQIDKARKLTGADYILAVISGNFVQRGEPTLVSKRDRVCMALSEGADLVLELPFPYSVSSAENYAFGAVSVLNASGSVKYMSFGSENGNLAQLYDAAEKLENDISVIKSGLSRGNSFAKSAEALTGLSKGNSNDILAVEYIKALRKINSAIIPFPILRTNGSYLGHPVASASEIRKSLSAGQLNQDIFDEFLPEKSSAVMKEAVSQGKGPVFLGNFEKMIFSVVRGGGPEYLASLPNVTEGLENKIYSASLDTDNIESLVASCVSKRYTSSRIKRILVNALVYQGGKPYDTSAPIPYIRVLGMRREASALSAEIKKNASVPYVMSNAEASKICPELAALESRAADIYALGLPGKIGPGRSEYKNELVIL